MWVKAVQLRRDGIKLPPDVVMTSESTYGYLQVDGQWAKLRNGESGKADHRDMFPALYEPAMKVKNGAIFVFGRETPGLSHTGPSYPQAWWCRPCEPPELDGYGRVPQLRAATYI